MRFSSTPCTLSSSQRAKQRKNKSTAETALFEPLRSGTPFRGADGAPLGGYSRPLRVSLYCFFSEFQAGQRPWYTRFLTAPSARISAQTSPSYTGTPSWSFSQPSAPL